MVGGESRRRKRYAVLTQCYYSFLSRAFSFLLCVQFLNCKKRLHYILSKRFSVLVFKFHREKVMSFKNLYYFKRFLFPVVNIAFCICREKSTSPTLLYNLNSIGIIMFPNFSLSNHALQFRSPMMLSNTTFHYRFDLSIFSSPRLPSSYDSYTLSSFFEVKVLL